MKAEEILDNSIVAFFVCFLTLSGFGVFLPDYWIILFSILCSYLVCDLSINLFIIGGSGIVQIPLLGNLTQEKGRGFVAFFVGIIISTIISLFLSDMILNAVRISTDWFTAVTSLSFGISVAIYADMKAKFYRRK